MGDGDDFNLVEISSDDLRRLQCYFTLDRRINMIRAKRRILAHCETEGLTIIKYNSEKRYEVRKEFVIHLGEHFGAVTVWGVPKKLLE